MSRPTANRSVAHPVYRHALLILIVVLALATPAVSASSPQATSQQDTGPTRGVEQLDDRNSIQPDSTETAGSESKSAQPWVSPQESGNCGPMDVAFLIDDTGSMGGAINNVKTELEAILSSIEAASEGDYRLALTTFKDNITIRENFASSNAESVGEKILGLSAGGGNGSPEASDETLNTVVNTLAAAGRPQNVDFTPAYRSSILKIAILVTDAPPGGFNDAYTVGVDDVNAHTRAVEAAEKQIRISAVFVPTGGDYSGQRAIMKDYADTTNGVFVETQANGVGTGAAINDIIARCGVGTPDADDDGLNDDWETNGIPGADLPAMGADKDVKDIFVQVNWMEDDKHNQKPSPDAIKKIVEAFKNSGVDEGKGIRLHVDVGPDSIDYVTGEKWGDKGMGHSIPWKKVVGEDESLWQAANDMLYMGSRQIDQVFRHCYFINEFKYTDPDTGQAQYNRSGLAFGDKQVFWVSLGAFWLGHGTTNDQAGTFMHELGHVLGLGHGGGDSINHKPNYLSVMNYSFQLSGVIKDGFLGIATDGYFDYSHFGETDLVKLWEKELTESEGIGEPKDSSGKKYQTKHAIFPPYTCKPWKLGSNVAYVTTAAKPVDWDCELFGHIDDETVAADINGEDGISDEPLSSYNDWKFVSFKGGNIGLPGTPPPLEITPEDVQNAPVEISEAEDRQIQRISEPRITLAKTVNPIAARINSTVRYEITTANMDAGEAFDTFLTDVLPADFTYQVNSTSGATSANPSIDGQNLTWGPLTVPGNGDAQPLTFALTVAGFPGVYWNSVTGASSNALVIDSVNTAPLMVTADRECTRLVPYWQQQFEPASAARDFDDPILTAFLEITDYASTVFSEQIPASTLQEAHAVLWILRPTVRQEARQRALASWLNFSQGSIGWNELVNTDKDGTPDTPFNEVMAKIEAVLANPNATVAELKQASLWAMAVNSHDKNAADCAQ